MPNAAPEELSSLAEGDERSELGLHGDEACGTSHRARGTRPVQKNRAPPRGAPSYTPRCCFRPWPRKLGSQIALRPTHSERRRASNREMHPSALYGASDTMIS